MFNPDYVVVLWDDAWIDGTEPILPHEVEAKHKPLKVKTPGWVLKSDEIGITIAHERYLDPGQNEVFRAYTFIPRQMIHSVTPVKLVVPRKRKPKPETTKATD